MIATLAHETGCLLRSTDTARSQKLVYRLIGASLNGWRRKIGKDLALIDNRAGKCLRRTSVEDSASQCWIGQRSNDAVGACF